MPTITLESAAPTSRVHRRPKHPFLSYQKPFAIVPVAIAPVLPAETLASWWCESRMVTDPIKNKLIGWSYELYGFYVKIRDLDDRDTLDDLFINPTASVSGLNEARSQKWYHAGGSPNYTKLAVKRIVETWFRDDGEAYNNVTIDGYPAAQIRDQGWKDSLVDTTVLSAGSGDPGSASTPEALDKLMDAYEYLRQMSLTQMTFEDYCRTFGINLATESLHKPERLFSVKEWQYPSNTIDPATGAATSAVSWVVKQSGRDPKLFKEPGFVVVLQVVRPKVYMGRQFGSMAHFLDQGLSWLPAIMAPAPETSLREFANNAGPLYFDTTVDVQPTNGYWVDMRDLFLYGDQFQNVADQPDGSVNALALPDAALNSKYPTEAMVDGLFTANTAEYCRCDGFVSLDIKGTQIDYTVGREARA